jgi:hypothetical protein
MEKKESLHMKIERPAVIAVEIFENDELVMLQELNMN